MDMSQKKSAIASIIKRATIPDGQPHDQVIGYLLSKSDAFVDTLFNDNPKRLLFWLNCDGIRL